METVKCHFMPKKCVVFVEIHVPTILVIPVSLCLALLRSSSQIELHFFIAGCVGFNSK